MADTSSDPPGRGDDLLALAEQAGQLGVFESDLGNGRFSLSAGYLRLMGIEHFDNRFETWLACVYREDQPRLLAEIVDSYKARLPKAESNFRIVRPSDGELRWIETQRLMFYGEGGRAVRVVGVAVDATERRRATAQLRAFTETLEDAVRERTIQLETQHEARCRAEEQLRQAQKMEAVGQLTGGVAHDFNNLLTVIIGGLDMIERQLPALGTSTATARIARAREMALQGAQRAATLTSRLLAFSRQQALKPKPIDANRLLAGLSELLRGTLGEAVQIETVLAGGLWLAHADENQLENALINLAVNARDAMPGGGKLTIETANCHLDEAYVAAVAEPVRPGQYVMIAATDTGIGMNSEALQRAFEPFFTTKAVGNGTGLGLSQVYGFANQSGGAVTVTSRPGVGSTFTLYLPRSDQPGPAPAGAAPLRETPDQGRLLLVEDNQYVAEVAKEMLAAAGYDVTRTSSAEEALAALDGGARFDLALSDVVLENGMSGLDLAQELRRRLPDLPVVLMTGYSEALATGDGHGFTVLAKPFGQSEITAALRAARNAVGPKAAE